jgi:hypothetical protein
MKSTRIAALVIALLMCTGGAVFAEENDSEPVDEAAEATQAQEELKKQMEADKTGTNPLNFSFDARLYHEYQGLNTTGDGAQNITTFEFRTPFAGGSWQFRGKIRGVGRTADNDGDGIDDVDEYGLGDTDLRFMTIPYLKKFGVATGVEIFLDTASEDVLGSGADKVAPFVFFGIFNPLGKGSLIVPGYQHIVSYREAAGRSEVHQGLIDIFIVKTFKSAKYWGYVDPQILLDYENSIEFMLLEIQAGMMVGPAGHSMWIMPSIGVGQDRPYDLSVELGYKIVWGG